MRRSYVLALTSWIVTGLAASAVGQTVPPKPAAVRTVAAVATHPLDPLTADELRAVVRIVRTHPDVPASALFPEIVLNEPPKAEVLAFKPGTPFRREAAVVVFDRPAGRTLAAVVDLQEAGRRQTDRCCLAPNPPSPSTSSTACLISSVRTRPGRTRCGNGA